MHDQDLTPRYLGPGALATVLYCHNLGLILVTESEERH